MRSVELHAMDSNGHAVLWRAYVLPTGADMYQSSQITEPDSVDITLEMSSTTIESEIAISLAFDGGATTQMTAIAAGGKVLLKGLKVPNAKLWSPDNPNLHTVKIGYLGGYVTERFGLRTFGVDKATSWVTVNGKIVKLVGWNHHTQCVTAASPIDEQMDADIALLKKGNANYVRGAHYPHDPRMLDWFDEAGIFF